MIVSKIWINLNKSKLVCALSKWCFQDIGQLVDYHCCWITGIYGCGGALLRCRVLKLTAIGILCLKYYYFCELREIVYTNN